MEPMYEVRQKISNHHVLTDLERGVVVYRTADNMDVKQMPISAGGKVLNGLTKRRKDEAALYFS